MTTFALFVLIALSIWQSRAIHKLNRKANKQMASQKELSDKLTSIGDELDKAFAEITSAIQALKDALANAGNTTPEVDAAVTRLDNVAKALDDINPDETPTP